MREIQLTRGYAALVDDEDFERLNMFKWCVEIKQSVVNGQIRYYAKRTVLVGTHQVDLRMHREVLLLKPGDPFVDHEDANGLNNQKHNLRLATQSQNLGNQRKRATKATSQYKGVSWDATAHRWRSHLRMGSLDIIRKYCESELEAALAYDEAAREAFGKFARTNFT